MEDGVWSQIVKIQPIVEHEPPHKGVKGEAQASEEVRDKHNAIVGLRRGDNLPRSKKLVLDIGGQVSDLPKLRNILLRIEEATHWPAASDPDILEDLWCWSLGFGRWSSRCEKEQERWRRGVGLDPFIKGMNTKSPQRDRLRLI